MKYRYSLAYSLLLSTLMMPVMAQEATEAPTEEVAQLDTITAELEKFKAAANLKETANLGLLGKQLAFTSAIAVVNYDEKAFAEQSPRNVVDALAKIDSSVMNFGGETNTISGVYVRGLQLDARQISVNGLAGLYSAYNSPTAAVSSAQLIKGASTVTSGMDPEGSAGASMNIETKRATDDPITKVGLAWYSESRIQPSIDVGRRFGENNEWGIRVNGKYRNGDTPRQHFTEKAGEAAVALDYRGEKLRVALDYMYNERSTTGGRARIQDMQNLTFAMPTAPKGDINLVPEWSAQKTKDQTAMVTFEYDLPHNMMLSGGYGEMRSVYSGSFSQLRMLNAKGDYEMAASRSMEFRHRVKSANLGLSGSFYTGDISHQWNFAFDHVERSRYHLQSASIAKSALKTNIYRPVFPASPQLVGPTQLSVNQRLTAQSLALSDTIGFFEDKFRVTLGGRFQWIKQNNKLVNESATASRFSPMVTLAYVPNADFVMYANYLEDLEPGAFDVETGEMNSPRVTKQIEAGIRNNWSEQLTTTLSVFEIKRPGVIRGNTAAMASRAGKEQGSERNRGIEFNAYTSLFDDTLRASLGLTYMQAKLINYPSYADKIVNGVQVASPRWISKIGVEWDATENLSLNAGLQYYGKSYQDVGAKYALPSYTTVDLGAKYKMKLQGQKELTLRVGVENVFNKGYWQVQRGQYDRSFAVVGMPRTYWANMEFSY